MRSSRSVIRALAFGEASSRLEEPTVSRLGCWALLLRQFSFRCMAAEPSVPAVPVMSRDSARVEVSAFVVRSKVVELELPPK